MQPICALWHQGWMSLIHRLTDYCQSLREMDHIVGIHGIIQSQPILRPGT